MKVLAKLANMHTKSPLSTTLLCLPLLLGASLTACHSADPVKPAVSAHQEQKGGMAPTLAQLADYDWRLIKADGALSPFINKASLDFRDGKLGFGVGCNLHTGEFSLNDGVISLNKDRLAVTRRACEPALHQAESALSDSLVMAHLAFAADITNKRKAILTQTKDGHTWVWQGNKKRSTIYGEPVTLFWEISPEPAVCADSASVHCLKIRHVRYDDYGVKIGAGAWQRFEGKIENYQHEPHLAKIVRIKAYQDTASARQPIYVYDQTVESTVVK